MKRSASAIWEGTIKEGNGKISMESGVLKNTQYSYKSRFEHGNGTNPEELIGAAHAGCYTMQLCAYLSEEDFKPEKLETKADITFEDGEVTLSHLTVEAEITGIKQKKFDKLVDKAKENCPISKLLDTKITVSASLKS